MTRLQKIEEDVAKLSGDELSRFRSWFERFDAARFDAAIATDAASGALDSLADAALPDLAAGSSTALSTSPSRP